MTIKQQLLDAGMKEEQIDSWASDLYVLKTSISDKWVEGYEFKMNVTVFKSKTDGMKWYEIPFGYIDEHIASKSKS